MLAVGRPNPLASQRWNGGARVAEATCDACGTAYLDYVKRIAKAKRHYCSRRCQFAARRGEANPNWRGGPAHRECRSCGAAFTITPGALKFRASDFCSPACKAAGTRIYETKAIAHREHGRRREARKRAGRSIKTHTRAEWLALLLRYKHRCAECRKKRPLTRDHIVPLSKGGHDGIENIQPLCKTCNTSKGDRLWLLC